MTANSSYLDYFRKMLELQEKLRKSEEERLDLEKKYDLMEREAQLKHEISINKLRMRYIEFLEEQRMREQRNHELLKALDRVDESLALMSAKADRLHALKEEYDALMIRVSVNRRQTGSVAIDSGIISQNEERKSRKGLHASSHHMPKPHSDIERMLFTSSTSQSISQNLNHITHHPTKVFDRTSSSLHIPRSFGNHSELSFQHRQSQLGNYKRYDGSQPSLCEFGNNACTGGYTSNDSDPLLKRYARKNMVMEALSSPQYSKGFISSMSKPKSTSVPGALLNSKEEHVGCVLENELDRYIHKIRSLHDNSDTHSLEEVEQNTSGDLLNVTLSDDSLHHLPAEEKIQNQEIITGMDKILEIADDLISKVIHEEDPMSHVVPDQITEELAHAVKNGQNSLNKSKIDSCEAVKDVNTSKLDTQPISLAPTSSLIIENASNNSMEMHITKSPPSEMNIEAITTPSSMDDPLHVEPAQQQRSNFEFPNKHIVAENIQDHEEIVKSIDLCDQLQVITNENHEPVTDMVLSNTDDLGKGERTMSTNETVNSIDTLPHYKNDAPSYNVGKISAKIEQDETIKENVMHTISITSIPHKDIISNGENSMNEEQTVITDYNVPEQENENLQKQQFEQLYTQHLQDYPQNSNEIYEYNGEQYHHDPNQQYQYDPNLQYQQNANEEYQYDQQNLQYIEDPNAQYQDQPYITDGEQQYAMNPDEQYHGYTDDPHNQYESEAYIQNSDANYDPNTPYTYPTNNQNYAKENDYDAPQSFALDQQHQEYQEELNHYDTHQDIKEDTMTNHQIEDSSSSQNGNVQPEEQCNLDVIESNIPQVNHHTTKKSINAVESALDSETDSIIEKNISNTESDFDFN